jgi:pimeloyl-ACP methyl ester carboxylesterase
MMWHEVLTDAQQGRRLAALGVVVATWLTLSGCSAGTSGTSETETSTTPAPTTTVESGEVEFDGNTVSYSCAGAGSPAVMLEAGSDSPGTDSWPTAFVAPIAEETTVCTYDRLGTGSGSSAPPDQPRIFEDLVGVLDGVLTALDLEPPYVMAGQSAGGNIVVAYAEAHPDRVAALVPIEAYHDDPAEVMAWQADEGFTWEDNPEHIDIVEVAVEQDAYAMPFGEFPVLVISATEDGPQAAENQAHWLGISPDSRQVVIDGPHDIQETAPEEVAAEIVDLLAGLEPQ